MNNHAATLHATALSLFATSQNLFWSILPVAVLLAFVSIYASGEISGQRFEGLFRRILIAIALLIGFPQISNAIQGMESYLVQSFGGNQSVTELFTKVSERAGEIKSAGEFNWLQVGQIGLSIISTLSFLVLAVVKHFLDVLHLTTWNLLHIFGPLALLGCLYPSWSQVPKGIFMGMLELSLWQPIWVVLARLLLANGFGDAPDDPSKWFDTAVENFAVAGLMISTPMLAHGFLSGTLASVGGSTLGAMLAGAGAVMTAAPMKAIQSVTGKIGNVAMRAVNPFQNKKVQSTPKKVSPINSINKKK